MEAIEKYGYEEVEEEIYNGFEVKDLATADWAMETIKNNDKEAQERLDYADLKILELQEYKKRTIAERDYKNGFLQGKLMEYLRARREEDPNFKIKTVNGTVSTRTTKSWSYDDKKVLEFLKNNGLTDLIRFKEDPDKAAIKKAFKIYGNYVVDEDGQVVDGIEIQEKENISIRYK